MMRIRTSVHRIRMGGAVPQFFSVVDVPFLVLAIRLSGPLLH